MIEQRYPRGSTDGHSLIRQLLGFIERTLNRQGVRNVHADRGSLYVVGKVDEICDHDLFAAKLQRTRAVATDFVPRGGGLDRMQVWFAGRAAERFLERQPLLRGVH